MNDINRLKEQQKDKHPGFNSYLECMTRSLFSGLIAFGLGFAGFNLSQKLLARYLPYNRSTVGVLISTIISTGAAYTVTSERTYACQQAWIEEEKDLIEERHNQTYSQK